MQAWMIWIALAALFAAGEVMSMGFFLAPFAIGALFAAIVDLAGASDALSVIMFLVTSGVLFGFVRPIARRHMRTPAQLRTGTAALIGRTALVTERVDNDAQTGSVKLEGELWTARAWDDEEVIEMGTRVSVVEIRGATALVSEM